MENTEWNPGKLLEMSGYYWKTCTLHTSVKLGVYTVIGEKAMTAEEIAGKLNCDERATGMLLNALSAMDLLEKKDDLFRNTKSGKQFLSQDSPAYIGYMIKHHQHLVESWSKMDESVKSGQPVRTRASFDDPEVRESFLMGMFNIAMGVAPNIAKQIDLSGRSKLLDLGGGPGTYAIHFCMNNPKLNAVVFDLPTTRPFAEKTILRFNLSDRVSFMEGNFLKDKIQGTFDAAWLSHVLHAEKPEDCLEMLKKTVSAMTRGGIVMIHEFILNNTMDGPLFPALFSLNMLHGTSGGQAYSEKQLIDMMTSAGITDIKRLSFVGPTESGILTGIVNA